MTRTTRTLFGSLLLVALAVAVVATLRLRSERAPRRQLDGTGAIRGSLDTWPPVRRAPGPATTTAG